MQISIPVNDLLADGRERVLLDVRKPMARSASGHQIPGAQWRHPFEAVNWAAEFQGRSVAVFCVHGHEVSQAVAGFLRDEGVDAVYLVGGFEAWQEAGGEVVALDTKNA